MLRAANLMIMGYFVILFTERLQSLLRSAKDRSVKLFGDRFNGYIYGLAFASLAGFLVLMLMSGRQFILSLFGAMPAELSVHHLRMITLCIGVILFSGMVHTEYTIPPIQFASYGLLIAALVLYTIHYQPAAESKILLWMSLIYLVLFSMAIPVVYRSHIMRQKTFHVLECATSFILVILFTLLTLRVMTGDAENLFTVFPIVIAAAGDIPVIAMRWKEEKNLFVLIFLSASVLMWIIGRVTAILL